ncbi:hypothetical protein CDEF62S_00497 [Castellaniella defragrans]
MRLSYGCRTPCGGARDPVQRLRDTESDAHPATDHTQLASVDPAAGRDQRRHHAGGRHAGCLSGTTPAAHGQHAGVQRGIRPEARHHHNRHAASARSGTWRTRRKSCNRPSWTLPSCARNWIVCANRESASIPSCSPIRRASFRWRPPKTWSWSTGAPIPPRRWRRGACTPLSSASPSSACSAISPSQSPTHCSMPTDTTWVT